MYDFKNNELREITNTIKAIIPDKNAIFEPLVTENGDVIYTFQYNLLSNDYIIIEKYHDNVLLTDIGVYATGINTLLTGKQKKGYKDPHKSRVYIPGVEIPKLLDARYMDYINKKNLEKVSLSDKIDMMSFTNYFYKQLHTK